MPTLSITTTIEDAQRVASAVGYQLGLGRDATQAEVKGFVITNIRTLILNYERMMKEEAAKAAISPSASFDPT